MHGVFCRQNMSKYHKTAAKMYSSHSSTTTSDDDDDDDETMSIQQPNSMGYNKDGKDNNTFRKSHSTATSKNTATDNNEVPSLKKKHATYKNDQSSQSSSQASMTEFDYDDCTSTTDCDQQLHFSRMSKQHKSKRTHSKRHSSKSAGYSTVENDNGDTSTTDCDQNLHFSRIRKQHISRQMYSKSYTSENDCKSSAGVSGLRQRHSSKPWKSTSNDYSDYNFASTNLQRTSEGENSVDQLQSPLITSEYESDVTESSCASVRSCSTMKTTTSCTSTFSESESEYSVHSKVRNRNFRVQLITYKGTCGISVKASTVQMLIEGLKVKFQSKCSEHVIDRFLLKTDGDPMELTENTVELDFLQNSIAVKVISHPRGTNPISMEPKQVTENSSKQSSSLNHTVQ